MSGPQPFQAYALGVGLASTDQLIPAIKSRAPTSQDIQYHVGKLWVDTVNGNSYMLFSLSTSVGTTTANWGLIGNSSGDIVTLTGDSGTATPSSGNVQIAGGTNVTTSASGAIVTVNLDAAISLATSVTSPIYTTAAAADMNINSAAGQDIIVKMGDNAGANIVSFVDSDSAGVGIIDSNGGASFVAFTALAGADLLLTAPAGQDAIIKLGDAAGANVCQWTDSADASLATLNSDGQLNLVAGDCIVARSAASADVTCEVTNSDNTAADSDAFFEVAVGGTSGGNPGIRFQISGGQNYSMGIDNASAADDLVICGDNDLGTDVKLRIFESTSDVQVEQGHLKILAAGKTLQVEGGAVTDFIGSATLTAGAVTVANTNIAAGDVILISRRSVNGSTAIGNFTYSISAGASFTITSVQDAAPGSTETNDVSIVDYFIVRPL